MTEPIARIPVTVDSLPEARPGPWRSLRDALSGREFDFTREPLGRAIFLLAVPMGLEMAMESVFAVCDMFFVARLGVDAVAAVGLTEGVITVVYAVAVGMSMAATAMVARRIGEGRPRAAAVAAGQAVLLGIGVAAVIGTAGATQASRLLDLMGGSVSLVAGGTGYTTVLFGGSATIMLIFLNNAVLRGAGDATRAMRALWLANAVNLVLDPCFIFGWGPFPELGLTGAAVATTIGRGTGVLYQGLVLGRGTGRIRLERWAFVPDWPVLLRLLRVSVGGVGQHLVATASWVVLVRLVSSFGSAAVAGYTIAIRIILFALLPSWGVANAAATLVGQNLGAGLPDRAARAAWRTGWVNAALLMAVGAVFICWPGALVGLFTQAPAVVAVGTSCLRLIACGYGFYAFGMVIVSAFNGAGDTVTPTLVNLGCYWIFQIPLAWGLSRRLMLGPDGVFLAITLAESLLAVVGILLFRRGRWRHRII